MLVLCILILISAVYGLLCMIFNVILVLLLTFEFFNILFSLI